MRALSPLVLILLLAIAGCGEPTPIALDGGLDAAAPMGACDDDPCPPGELCVEEADAFRCECPAGSERTDEGCTPIATCEPRTCDGHGTCSMDGGEIACACDAGYAGERCEICADGLVRNHAGACVADLCSPSPCEDPDRRRCEVVDGAATCLCSAGTHDEDGACVPDTTCTATTCSGRGTCEETPEGIGCVCEPGTAGRFCDACEVGWHDDGAGGCTMDPCLPNPCTTALETVCVAEAGAARCECVPGAHREGSVCVADEVCATDTCASGGTCTVVLGRTECVCATGWTGARCDACEVGWHDDGAGGCTMDPCLPDPCTMPNRGVCTAAGTTATCGCDPGYHEDGAGGCTTDPCTPNPCLASGRACGVTAGAPECYVPVCDDGNPCTTDSVVAGSCSYAPRANGAACATSLCVTGQSCTAGVCGGGSAIVCDDGNPCTRDACSPTAGCGATADDTLVPGDGIACTIDVCASGAASHTPSDARCDDGQWCDGAERCAPGTGGAGSDGCVAGVAPVPPAPSTPCRRYAGCDEATDSFPRTDLPAGASCDDGLSCTSGDVCRASGVCTGVAMATCPAGGTCAATTPIASSSFDVPVARVTGRVTLGGASLPPSLATSYASGFDLFLVSRETEQRHYLARPSYTGSTSTLTAGTDAIRATLVPGVYDLVYDRGHDDGSSDTWPSVSRQAIPGELPNGYVVLQQGIVLGAGPQTLDVDVPVTRVTGAITLDGAPLPSSLAASYSSGFDLFLVSRSTGQRHYLARPSYTGSTSTLTPGTGAVSAVLVPGTYDLVYDRGHDDGGASYWPSVSRQAIPGELPNGYVVLRENVVLAPGAQTLDVNVPVTRVTGAITLDGAPLPSSLATSYSSGFDLFLVSRSTGQRHYLARPSYTGSTSTLTPGTDVVSAVLVPGTYDLVYDRGHDDGSADSWPSVSRQAIPGELPNGYVVLRENVVLAAGAQTLDVNVPVTRVTGAITLEGAPLPASLATSYASGFDLFLVSRSTGQRHYLARPSYTGSTSTLTPGTHVVSAVLVPGTYDLVYDRGHDDGSASYWPSVSRQAIPGQLPNGYVVLRENVVLGAGAQTLDVDVPVARVTGAITLAGAPLPSRLATSYASGFDLFLVSRSTGQRHYLARPSYTGSTSTLTAGTDVVSAVLVPGTYDLVYDRGHDDGSADYWSSVSRQSIPSELPNGYVVLRQGVVIAPGARTLDVDVPRAALSHPITLEGARLPPRLATSYASGFDLFLVSRSTGERHYVGRPSYTGSTSTLTAGTDVVSAVLVPGAYDLVYDRGHDDGSADSWSSVSRQSLPSELPNGYVLLRSCLVAE